MTAFEEVWRADGPGPALAVQEAEVVRNSRTWRQRRVVVNDGRVGVVIVAEHAGSVAFVRLFRPVVDEQRLELPRGFGEDDDPELDARRELVEETGLEPVAVRLLGTLELDTGLVPTPVAVIAAEAADTVPSAETDRETAELVWVQREDVVRLVADGTLRDAISLAALALWLVATA